MIKKSMHAGKWLYAIAFAVFGVQHFIYAGYVATLVPGWMPWHLFFACLTGAAFIATALSIIINKYVRLSCSLLAVLLLLFILFVHIPGLYDHPRNAQGYTRALQDIVIMGTALMLTGGRMLRAGKYLFAVPMIVLGLQHLAHVDFVTAKVPAYFAAVTLWDYMTALVMIAAAIGIISNRYMSAPALVLAVFLLSFALLYHVPFMITNIGEGRYWTGLMIDVAIAGGAFVASAISASGETVIHLRHNKAGTFS